MANIKVVGSSVVVISALSRETIEKANKYRPRVLTLVDEETKEPTFAIGLNEGAGCVGTYGVTFGEATYGDDALATATIIAIGDPKKDDIVDEFGGILINLNKVEAQISGVLEEINSEVAEIESAVSFE